jgi:NADH-quinone oxidoreductase subunit E
VIGRRRKKRELAHRDLALTPVVERPPADLPAAQPVREVARFGHGSRVPGWDDAVDLEKDPAEVPDPATTPVPAPLRAEIEAHMAKYPDFHSATIPALAAAQRHHGWCSPEAIWQAACVMRLTPGYLIAVASFYDMLETRPVGRHAVYVCTNISCSLCGADELYDRLRQETAADPEFNVRSFECLGACDIAPMASVDGIYVGPIALSEVPTLVEQIREGLPPLPDKQLRLRKSTDPNAARAVPGAADPLSPTTGYGAPMGGEVTGPPAAIEHPPVEEEEP